MAAFNALLIVTFLQGMNILELLHFCEEFFFNIGIYNILKNKSILLIISLVLFGANYLLLIINNKYQNMAEKIENETEIEKRKGPGQSHLNFHNFFSK